MNRTFHNTFSAMLLEVNHISKMFGRHSVLDDLSFRLDGGECLALFGTNGAGKTTLLRILVGLLAADRGAVVFDGHPLCQHDLTSIGYLPEERGLYRQMPVGEQLVYLARLKGMDKRAAEDATRWWLAQLGMEDTWSRLPQTLSKGMQQRIQIAASVVHHPRLLLLDEPFSGFDSQGEELLVMHLRRLLDEGTAVVLSSHRRSLAASLATQTLEL